MNPKSFNSKKPNKVLKNTIETAKDSGSSLKQFGGGFLDQLAGGQRWGENTATESLKREQETKVTPSPQRREFSIFNYQQYYEKEMVKKQIKELVEMIRKELAYIKQAEESLLTEVRDVEKIAIETLPAKPGIYHIRFLEIVLRLLQAVRAKIGESKTWLQAMISKKKKRGSLFLSLSKKKGTQYSLSQELQSARSVQ